MNLSEQLKKGLIELSIKFTEENIDKLVKYLELLIKWNKTYNLTAITEPEKMVAYHLLDSLAIQKFIKGHNIIDVGTGAGLPGIPLAIMNPTIEFTLLDSLSKRTKFLTQVAYELDLKNITIVKERSEVYHPDITYDQVVTRAVASLKDILKLTQHLASETGQFLAMKGANYQEELEEIGDTYTIVGIHPLYVPGLKAERHLIILEGAHCG